MKNSNNKNEIPKKAIELLPWYTAGSLSADEHTYIQETLLEYPELKELIDENHEISKTLFQNKSLFDLSIIGSSESRLEKVFESIKSETKRPVSNNTFINNGFIGQAKQLFDTVIGNISNKQYASITIVSILSLILLFAFVTPLTTEDQRSFYPATSEQKQQGSATTTVLLVGLNGSPASLEEITDLKKSLSAIEPVPGKEGMYRIKLIQKLNPIQTEKLIKLLMSKNELVWFAGEAF